MPLHFGPQKAKEEDESSKLLRLREHEKPPEKRGILPIPRRELKTFSSMQWATWPETAVLPLLSRFCPEVPPRLDKGK